MKLAVLLPGYLDSPDYRHMVMFEKMLRDIGYKVVRLDPGNLWKTGNIKNYSIHYYFNQIKQSIGKRNENIDEVILIGHSLGGFMAIVAGSKLDGVTKIVSLCPPPSVTGLVNDELEKIGYRTSTRDLPDNPNKTRVFKVPISAFKEAEKYSALEEIKKINKPIMIFIAGEDESVPPEETEKLISAAKVKPHVVKEPNMKHNFRLSRENTQKVANHIKDFLILSNTH